MKKSINGNKGKIRDSQHTGNLSPPLYRQRDEEVHAVVRAPPGSAAPAERSRKGGRMYTTCAEGIPHALNMKGRGGKVLSKHSIPVTEEH